MLFSAGKVYFIKDEFFEKIADPYLKINYEKTKRPHYLGIKDEKEDLYWMIPLSSKIEKFQKIIDDKKRKNKPADGIKIINIQDKTVALLFQDMFPVTEKYIDGLYIRNGQIFCISDPRKIIELEKHTKKVSRLLEKIRFTPTQPDTKRIYQMMKEEQHKENNIAD